jgi:hypothetical protein
MTDRMFKMFKKQPLKFVKVLMTLFYSLSQNDSMMF